MEDLENKITELPQTMEQMAKDDYQRKKSKKKKEQFTIHNAIS